MMLELLAGSLLVFVLSCAALYLGQWFGRGPIEGRCTPRGAQRCGQSGCCCSCEQRRES